MPIPPQAPNPLTRRALLGGLAGVLAAGCAPAFLRSSPTRSELADDAGQLLLTGLPRRTLTAPAARAITRGCFGGVVLFRRNLSTPEGTRDFIQGIHEAAAQGGRRAIVAVDQEGGAAQVISPPLASAWPAAHELGRRPLLEIQQSGQQLGRELAELGVNVVLAPVLDVGAGGPLGDRMFAAEPEAVARAAGAFARGVAASAWPTGKHFPGLGRVEADSHQVMPVCPLPVEALEARELVPFARLAPALPLMMVSHAAFPALAGGGAPRPASLDPRVVEGWLRERLGFAGVVVSDDLGMGAIRSSLPPGPAAVAALRAGCQLLMYCHEPGAAWAARGYVLEIAAKDAALRARIREAARTVARLQAGEIQVDRWG